VQSARPHNIHMICYEYIVSGSRGGVHPVQLAYRFACILVTIENFEITPLKHSRTSVALSDNRPTGNTLLRSSSGVPRILELEGSRCRRRRGKGSGERVSSSPLGEGSGEGVCPFLIKFSYFCLKYHILALSDTFIF